MLSALYKTLNSKLSHKFFLATLGIIFAIFTVIYVFSVPLIQQKVFEIERNSSRLALNNVFEIAQSMYANVEQYQEQALHTHQQQLKAAVSITASYIQARMDAVPENDKLALKNTRLDIFNEIRKFNYGNDDYIWIADYNSVMLSHPDPRFHGKDYRKQVDESGNPVLPSIVKQAIKEGEGYYHYKWHRLGQAEMLDKVSYVKSYPEWNLLIGSGVYLDDLDKEVQKKKKQVVDDLRMALNEIKIARTGYLFIFNAKNQMLIHPNANIEGNNIDDLINPMSKQFIAKELIDIADTGNELHYLWDKPDDPNNYVYEKLSLVRFLPGFDLYICSSVYLDELRSSSNQLSKRLLIFAVLTMLGAISLALLFSNRITRPLEQLANTALKVRRGDLSATSGIQRDDEVGILASSFDDMIERLKNNIDTLDLQVKQRTEELLETNAKAQRMHVVGQLAGGLAHDFNNLLSIILGNLLLIRERYDDVKGLDSFITPAITSSQRGAKITHRLLAFSRRQPLNPEAVNVDELLLETIKLLKGSLPSKINLSYQSQHSGIHVNVDPGQLESALINLALNARDAMPEGGALELSSRCITVEETLGHFDEVVPAGKYVEICVKDSGSGFDEVALQQAFEPFYTTKKDSENSGLGLSMVYGFVKQTNGYIRLKSTVPTGACIIILLPFIFSTQRQKPTTKKYIVNEECILKGKLFLLVEDNHDVRTVVRQQLMKFKLHVIESSTSEEAQLIINNLPNLDGMISDIVLNTDVSGIHLAQQLYQKNQQSIILLMSGYSYESSKEGLDFPLLHKPFNEETLYDGLLQALNKAKTGRKT